LIDERLQMYGIETRADARASIGASAAAPQTDSRLLSPADAV
jgi:hypothetical protein